MPHKPLRPCTEPGCPTLVERGRCSAHQQATRQAEDRERGSAAARGYDARWRKLRLMVLSGEPLCRVCRADGRVTAATLVDHVTPKSQGGSDHPTNLQPLCAPCHDAKTSGERHGLRRG